MRTTILPLISLTIALGACQTIDEGRANTIGQATLQLANGAPAGVARLMQNGSEVTISANLSGFQEGVRAVHLHTVGTCEAPDFTTAGDHLNPGGQQHGFDNPQGPHLGDLPNVTIGGDGRGTLSARLSQPAEVVIPQIFDADGTTIIVHEAADDYRTDPAGNAGGRIACGVFVES